ncbi:hypothetical protein [Streptomyces sp. NPDC101237]|uniref:MmyB family transcriptional regulator n=1 Tax=Streptomyces sp. NPDC101237 TaxID=3366139 RepID=UPI0038185A9D
MDERVADHQRAAGRTRSHRSGPRPAARPAGCIARLAASEHQWVDRERQRPQAAAADWAKAAQECVAYLRMDAVRYPDDPDLARLVGELSFEDEDFGAWWSDHRVRARRQGRKRFGHRVAGDLELDFQALDVRGGSDQSLLVHTAEPGSHSAEAPAFLTSRSAARAPQGRPEPAPGRAPGVNARRAATGSARTRCRSCPAPGSYAAERGGAGRRKTPYQ